MKVYKNSLIGLLVICSLSCVFGQERTFTGTLQDKSSHQMPSDMFANYEIVQLETESLVDYITDKQDDFLISLHFSDDYSFENLRLFENDVRSDDYIVRTISSLGESVYSINNEDNISFTGHSHTSRTDKVVLSITTDFIVGFITENEIKYYIEPLRFSRDRVSRDLYIIYTLPELIPELIPARSHKCIARHADEKLEELIVNFNGPTSDCYKIRIASANDYSIFTEYNSNVNDLTNLNMSIINMVGENFDDEFNYDLTFEIVEQLIVTQSGSDPWQTNTNDSREQYDYFAAWGEAGGFDNWYNLGTMWTNREFSVNSNTSWGGLNGLYISSQRYTLRLNPSINVIPPAVLIPGIARHEIGHNFGAQHTSENCNMRNFFASCWTADNQVRMNNAIAEAIDRDIVRNCIDCGDGILTLDSTDIDCPIDPFQVCGLFGNPTCIDVTPVFSLRILTSSGNQVGNLITDPNIDVANGSFCFTVDPSDFGDEPMGTFEFEVNAIYSPEISTQDSGANDGPDAVFIDCPPPCPKAGPDVNVSFCQSNMSYHLADYLVDADSIGFWDASFSDGLFNPLTDGNLGFTSATYTIPSTVDCDEDSATISIAINDCTGTGGYDNGNWYFGEEAGLSFNGNTTSVLLNGQTPFDHQCTATASDHNGNLLFYTNGNTVWNKSHEVMEGGDNSLLASNDKDQSVVILPIPNTNQYYIFTEKVSSTYNDGTFNSIYYFSIVNLDENDGFGRVEQVNTELFRTSFFAEVNGEFLDFQWAYHHNMTTALHADGENYWLILHPSNAIVSFHITEEILSALPTFELSTIGNFNSNPDCSSIIEYSLKASPRGDKLAYVGSNFGCLGFSDVFIIDFNNETGLISGYPASLNESLPIPYYTSVEFSASGDILYGDYREVGGNYEIHAYDLNGIGPDPLIIDSGILNTDPYAFRGNFIQRAVDGRIYSTLGSSSTLISTLTNINDLENVNLTEDAIDLTREKGGFPQDIPLHGFSFMRCAPELIVTRDVLDRHVDVQYAQNTIVLEHCIKEGATAVYKAGSEVILGANFQIEGGSQFNSFIEGCQ